MKGVPTVSGCYIMRDRRDLVLYVGKAKNLRARLRSYINESDTRYAVRFLVRRVADIEFLVTRTDKEAVLLENSLIKQHKPRYNVRLRDDKTYVSLRINVAEDFPRVTVVRRYRKDGARYFGPYASAGAVRETLRQIQRMFPLRTCTDAVIKNRTRPCLYYQMKRCVAPCVKYIDSDKYHEIVQQVLMVLEGRNAELKKLLAGRTREHAQKLEFEEAAVLRDRLFALRKTLERQRTVSVGGAEDRDVFGFCTHGRFTEVQVLFYRGGKMEGGRSFSFKQTEMPMAELFGSFLLQYYTGAPVIPMEILTPLRLEEADTLAEILSEQRGAKVTVHWPQRGEKRALIDLAARNARRSFDEKRLAERANEDLLEQVRIRLKLTKRPYRIECFDISTTQGANAVGAMVVFEGGVPNKSRYRRFAIRHVAGQDDFAMMREVFLRRYKRAIEEGDLPDLVLVDGGKGQLGVATTVFKDLGVEDLAAVGIAKARNLAGRARSPERFFVPGRKNPIIIAQDSEVVLYLVRIRDEAHRLAITYHRKRRGKALIRTPLIEIPGVGPKRAKTLLKELGSLDAVRSATVDAIAALPGFNKKLARVVKDHVNAPGGGRAE